MSLQEEKQFWDVTPHRIRVTSYGKRNNNGRRDLEPGTARTYRCLISETVTLARGLQGDSSTVGVNANVLATPMEQERLDNPQTVEIKSEDKVEFLNPSQETRPIQSVERYYDETGDLHNMVVHFS